MNGIKLTPVSFERPVRTFFTEMVERSEAFRISSIRGMYWESLKH